MRARDVISRGEGRLRCVVKARRDAAVVPGVIVAVRGARRLTCGDRVGPTAAAAARRGS